MTQNLLIKKILERYSTEDEKSSQETQKKEENKKLNTDLSNPKSEEKTEDEVFFGKIEERFSNVKKQFLEGAISREDLKSKLIEIIEGDSTSQANREKKVTDIVGAARQAIAELESKQEE